MRVRLLLVGLAAAALTAAVASLLLNITERKREARERYVELVR